MCCVPNAGRSYLYCVRALWLRSPQGLVAGLYGDCALHTTLNGVQVTIREETRYPFDLIVHFSLEMERPTAFELALHLPAWADGFELSGADAAEVRDGFIHIRRTWHSTDHFSLRFSARVETHSWRESEVYFSRGPLLFALPLAGETRPGRSYPLPVFQDEKIDPAVRCTAPLVLILCRLSAWNRGPSTHNTPGKHWRCAASLPAVRPAWFPWGRPFCARSPSPGKVCRNAPFHGQVE